VATVKNKVLVTETKAVAIPRAKRSVGPMLVGNMPQATVETKVEGLLEELDKVTTFCRAKIIVGGFMGMRLFKPTDREILKLTEFDRIFSLSERKNGNRADRSPFFVHCYKVLVRTIISRSVKAELSREQTLFTRLFSGQPQPVSE
jgi:hypothetical protein